MYFYSYHSESRSIDLWHGNGYIPSTFGKVVFVNLAFSLNQIGRQHRPIFILSVSKSDFSVPQSSIFIAIVSVVSL